MSTDKTLADVQPGGRVRLGDRPKDGEVLVEVSGLTGSGKSAIAGEIEILCKTLGLEVEWINGDEEKRLTHADWIGALELYKPKVVIVEQNIPRAALSAQPSPGGQGDALHAAVSAIYFDDSSDYQGALWNVVRALNLVVAGLLERDPDAAYEATRPGNSELAARQPVGDCSESTLYEAVGNLLEAPGSWTSGYTDALHDLREAYSHYGQKPVKQKPLAEVSRKSFNSDGTSNIITPALPLGTRLYAAPPAQGVDLGQFRRVLLAAIDKFGGIPADATAAEKLRELLDLIGGQAVGK